MDVYTLVNLIMDKYEYSFLHSLGFFRLFSFVIHVVNNLQIRACHPWLPKQLTSNLPIPKEVLWLEVQVNLYNMWTPMGKFVVEAVFQKNSCLFTYWPKCTKEFQNVEF